MPLRLVSYALLLIAVVAFRLPATPQSGPEQEEPATEPRWEYKVVKIDQFRCSNEQLMVATLNTIGQRGWELMSYERLAPSSPNKADGTMLLKPAATGAGKLNNPQTVDSFEGTITLKMAQDRAPECGLLFKRISHTPAKP